MPAMLTTKIIIVYPNQLFCGSVCQGLRKTGHTIVAQAHNRDEALALLESAKPALALVGSNLNEHEAFRLCRAVRAWAPKLNVIIITAQADDLLVQADTFQAGAAASLSPNLDIKAYRAAVADVLRGKTLIPHEALSPTLQPAEPTVREREVMKLMAEDKTDREIATQLQLSLDTVHTHHKHILKKLGTHRKSEAVRRALRRGWCD